MPDQFFRESLQRHDHLELAVLIFELALTAILLTPMQQSPGSMNYRAAPRFKSPRESIIAAGRARSFCGRCLGRRYNQEFLDAREYPDDLAGAILRAASALGECGHLGAGPNWSHRPMIAAFIGWASRTVKA